MRKLIIWLGLAGTIASPLAAQVQGRPPPSDQRQPADTIEVEPFRVRPPISPLGALGRSLLVPGWGQAVLGRKVTGALFVFWEGVTLTMTLKSIHQKHYLESIGSNNVDDKSQEIQDWAVLLAFNHLFSAAEAFVAAQLWDFPGELELTAGPDGRLGVVASVPFH